MSNTRPNPRQMGSDRSNDPIEFIAEQIGLPIEEWKGNCYGVSTKIVQAGFYDGEPAYGHYYGPIAESGYFGAQANCPFVRHGWIELDNPDEGKEIVDPTRWCFENAEPYIYHGPDDEYDRGGQRMRERTHEPPPDDPDGDRIQLNLDHEVLIYVITLLEDDVQRDTFYRDELMWLANAPISLLEPHAEEIYREYKDQDIQYMIPIDHRHQVLPEEGPTS